MLKRLFFKPGGNPTLAGSMLAGAGIMSLCIVGLVVVFAPPALIIHGTDHADIVQMLASIVLILMWFGAVGGAFTYLLGDALRPMVDPGATQRAMMRALEEQERLRRASINRRHLRLAPEDENEPTR